MSYLDLPDAFVVDADPAAQHDAEVAQRAQMELLAILGHDLRNPLNAIVTSVEVLRRVAAEGGLAARSESALAASAESVMARQTVKLTNMVERLLEIGHVLAEPVGLNPSEFALRALLESVVATRRSIAAGRGQTLGTDFPAEIYVRADPVCVEHMLADLLDRAIELAQPNGHLQISLTRLDADARLRVGDDGPGLPPERAARLFDPVQDSVCANSRVFEHRLMLVRQRALQYGGWVAVQSSARGTTFELSLPALPQPSNGFL